MVNILQKKKLWVLVVILMLGFMVWGLLWATYARPPLPEALAALESDALVTVSSTPWLRFTPAGALIPARMPV